MKLHLEDNIAEGTPEELVEYLRLVEAGDKPKIPLFSFGHAHQPDEDTLKSLIGSLVKVAEEYTGATEEPEEAEEESEEPSKELKVGDKVKVVTSSGGAEGEATVTAVLDNGYVEVSGIDKHGNFLPNWSSHVSLLEKIEEDEDLEPEDVDEDAPMGYRYWYLAGTTFNKFVVLEASPEGYFEDSTGKRYTHKAVSGHVKPIDREDAYVQFDDAEREGALLRYYPTVNSFLTSY